MSDDYTGPERRMHPALSDDMINKIAERAAEVALAKVYTQIGKSVVNKVLWIIGTLSVALFLFLKKNGLA